MSRRQLSLHHLSVAELSPVDLVRTAASIGYDRVCAFTHDRGRSERLFPLIEPHEAPEMRRALDGEGLSLCNIELFILTPDVDVAQFERPLALGASLGGTSATAIVFDTDDDRAAANFAKFGELCAQHAVKAGLEFVAFTAVKTIEHACRIVQKASHPSVAVALDPLHFVRGGSTLEMLKAIDPAMIGYMQFCDGPACMPEDRQREEAMYNRLAPGEGTFPLRELLAVVPSDVCLSLEAPMNRLREKGVDAGQRARLIFDAANDFF